MVKKTRPQNPRFSRIQNFLEESDKGYSRKIQLKLVEIKTVAAQKKIFKDFIICHMENTALLQTPCFSKDQNFLKEYNRGKL